jgi:hypothetical protein
MNPSGWVAAATASPRCWRIESTSFPAHLESPLCLRALRPSRQPGLVGSPCWAETSDVARGGASVDLHLRTAIAFFQAPANLRCDGRGGASSSATVRPGERASAERCRDQNRGAALRRGGVPLKCYHACRPLYDAEQLHLRRRAGGADDAVSPGSTPEVVSPRESEGWNQGSTADITACVTREPKRLSPRAEGENNGKLIGSQTATEGQRHCMPRRSPARWNGAGPPQDLRRGAAGRPAALSTSAVAGSAGNSTQVRALVRTGGRCAVVMIFSGIVSRRHHLSGKISGVLFARAETQRKTASVQRLLQKPRPPNSPRGWSADVDLGGAVSR